MHVGGLFTGSFLVWGLLFSQTGRGGASPDIRLRIVSITRADLDPSVPLVKVQYDMTLVGTDRRPLYLPILNASISTAEVQYRPRNTAEHWRRLYTASNYTLAKPNEMEPCRALKAGKTMEVKGVTSSVMTSGQLWPVGPMEYRFILETRCSRGNRIWTETLFSPGVELPPSVTP